jgi:hypothetical protein
MDAEGIDVRCLPAPAVATMTGRRFPAKRISPKLALMQPNQGQNVRVFFALVDCDKSQFLESPSENLC